METEATWPADWSAQREGAGCVLCGRTQIDDDEWGTRVFTGRAVDGFVWKTGRVAGYVLAIWNGDHVAEPTQLDRSDAATYWAELTELGRAVETCCRPAKINYLTLGNNVPHLHTHIVPRHWHDDPDPHGPLGFDHLDQPRQPSRQVEDTVRTLRRILADAQPHATYDC